MIFEKVMNWVFRVLPLVSDYIILHLYFLRYRVYGQHHNGTVFLLGNIIFMMEKYLHYCI